MVEREEFKAWLKVKEFVGLNFLTESVSVTSPVNGLLLMLANHQEEEENLYLLSVFSGKVGSFLPDKFYLRGIKTHLTVGEYKALENSEKNQQGQIAFWQDEILFEEELGDFSESFLKLEKFNFLTENKKEAASVSLQNLWILFGQEEETAEKLGERIIAEKKKNIWSYPIWFSDNDFDDNYYNLGEFTLAGVGGYVVVSTQILWGLCYIYHLLNGEPGGSDFSFSSFKEENAKQFFVFGAKKVLLWQQQGQTNLLENIDVFCDFVKEKANDSIFAGKLGYGLEDDVVFRVNKLGVGLKNFKS